MFIIFLKLNIILQISISIFCHVAASCKWWRKPQKPQPNPKSLATFSLALPKFETEQWLNIDFRYGLHLLCKNDISFSSVWKICCRLHIHCYFLKMDMTLVIELLFSENEHDNMIIEVLFSEYEHDSMFIKVLFSEYEHDIMVIEVAYGYFSIIWHSRCDWQPMVQVIVSISTSQPI